MVRHSLHQEATFLIWQGAVSTLVCVIGLSRYLQHW